MVENIVDVRVYENVTKILQICCCSHSCKKQVQVRNLYYTFVNFCCKIVPNMYFKQDA